MRSFAIPPRLLANSPSLERNAQDNPRHQQTNQAHGDSVHEHGVELVMDHAADGVTRTSHEDDAAADQTESSEELGGWT